jgi:hypothetical protein
VRYISANPFAMEANALAINAAAAATRYERWPLPTNMRAPTLPPIHNDRKPDRRQQQRGVIDQPRGTRDHDSEQ